MSSQLVIFRALFWSPDHNVKKKSGKSTNKKILVLGERSRASIRLPDKSVFWKTVFFISHPKYSKEPSQWDSSFEHPNDG